jgi:hypothetical protein
MLSTNATGLKVPDMIDSAQLRVAVLSEVTRYGRPSRAERRSRRCPTPTALG